MLSWENSTNADEAIVSKRTVNHGMFNFFTGAYCHDGEGLFRSVYWLVRPEVASQASNMPGFLASSTDGLVWRGPERITFSFPELKKDEAIYISPRGVVMPDSRILAVAYTTFQGDTKYRSILLASDDRGMSWHYVSTVASEKDVTWGGEGPCEPMLCQLPNGELLCMMRTGGEAFYGRQAASSPLALARSSDGGKTWTHQKMRVPGVMPKLLRMSNGVLVCAFGRPGNGLIFSVDGGHCWGREIALTAADAQTSGYCDLVEVEPGRLLVVFDGYNVPTSKIWLWEPKEINGVYGVFVDVKGKGRAL